MVTEQMTKTQFIVEVLNRDIDNINKAQLLIAEKNIRLQGSSLKQVRRPGRKIGEKSGQVLESLHNPSYSIAGVDGKFQVQSLIPLQLRFLDMKHLGNWMIYNRQVWGILYRNSMVDIKYRYGDNIRNLLGEALRNALNK